MKKLLTGFLLLVLAIFQFQIWFGDSSVRELSVLQASLDQQRASNEQSRARNEALEVEVRDLADGEEALEERARSELNMIGEDETFFMIVEQ